MSTITMLILIGFIQAFLHYVSRREVLGRDLPRPVAYVLGTLAMMGPFTAWLLERAYNEIALTLWLVLSVGGAVVLVTYAADWARGMFLAARESKAIQEAAVTALKEELDVKNKGE